MWHNTFQLVFFILNISYKQRVAKWPPMRASGERSANPTALVGPSRDYLA